MADDAVKSILNFIRALKSDKYNVVQIRVAQSKVIWENLVEIADIVRKSREVWTNLKEIEFHGVSYI